MTGKTSTNQLFSKIPLPLSSYDTKRDMALHLILLNKVMYENF
jgi:hypothetical protein